MSGTSRASASLHLGAPSSTFRLHTNTLYSQSLALILGFDKIMSIISSGGRVRVGRVNGKPYLHLVYLMMVRCVLVGSIGTLRMLD
jgi:hypothetical protein